jgi:hypothetical protein
MRGLYRCLDGALRRLRQDFPDTEVVQERLIECYVGDFPVRSETPLSSYKSLVVTRTPDTTTTRFARKFVFAGGGIHRSRKKSIKDSA